MNQEEIRQVLVDIPLRFNEPLSNYTYTKTGGPADVLIFPKTKEEVQKVITYCNTHNIPWLCLGNASNLIVRDGGIRGFVISLEKINQVQLEENNLLTAGAGAKLIDVTYFALDHRLSGLEFACGIPGSIGGAAYMNAGAYGGELVDAFESCDVVFPDGTFQTLTKNEMAFSYRHSILQENHAVVISVTFNLTTGNFDTMKAKMDELTHLRESKQPLEYPSCGSVFKRPDGHFTGQLIQEAGLQGKFWGGAQISEKHAGFIVNINQATATDYINLIKYIQKTILEKYDVVLETEVRIIGDER